jgi:hypothetical protein
MNTPDKDPKTATRESWLKVGVVTLFSAVIAYKIIAAPFSVDFKDFNFTELLNLLLAIAAVTLSVAFYFKATDASTLFYDNTYKFTQQVSEILGRIEAGFGERLRHLDEGYTGLQRKFDNWPPDTAKADKQIKKEEDELKRKEEEKAKLLEDLAARANLEHKEKETLFKQLREKDEALAMTRHELMFLQEQRRHAGDPETLAVPLPTDVANYLRSRVLGSESLRPEIVLDAPASIIRERFRRLQDDMPRGFLHESRDLGLLNRNFDLTDGGVATLRLLARHMSHRRQVAHDGTPDNPRAESE